MCPTKLDPAYDLPLPPDYLCKICGRKDHWINTCPQNKSAQAVTEQRLRARAELEKRVKQRDRERAQNERQLQTRLSVVKSEGDYSSPVPRRGFESSDLSKRTSGTHRDNGYGVIRAKRIKEDDAATGRGVSRQPGHVEPRSPPEDKAVRRLSYYDHEPDGGDQVGFVSTSARGKKKDSRCRNDCEDVSNGS